MPVASGHPTIMVEKSTRIFPSASGAGLPRLVVVIGCVAPSRKTCRSYRATIGSPPAVNDEWSAEGSNSTTFGFTTGVVWPQAGTVGSAHRMATRRTGGISLCTFALHQGSGMPRVPRLRYKATCVPSVVEQDTQESGGIHG
jgi:hypothetical protein